MSSTERVKELEEKNRSGQEKKDDKSTDNSKNTNIYKEVWEKAFERYKNRDSRPGFQMTFFSHFRHNFKLYPALAEFKKELQDSKNENSEQIMTMWLNNTEKLKNNEHSFRSYLIDELQKEFPNSDKWNTLSKHQYKFYTGIVYRGASDSPSDVFKNGFKDTGRMFDIRNYTADVSGHVGISTSKDISIAFKYTKGALGNRGLFTPGGYLYKINLRSSNGLDLDAMGTKSKREVNVIGGIKREDIIGTVDEKGKILRSNRHYEPERLSDEINNIPEALEKNFRAS